MSAQAFLRTLTGHIEASLDGPLQLDDLSRAMGLSRWQIRRSFSALTGYSISHYIRLRKLSVAARALTESEQRILDIALGAGFESQEAFTRAFCRHFGQPPGLYRRSGVLHGVIEPLFITDCSQHNTGARIAMNIRLETKPAMRICGLGGRFNGSGSDAPDNFEVIGRLWDAMNGSDTAQRLACRPGQSDGQWYGLIRMTEETKHCSDNLHYLAGVNSQQADLPAGWECETVPEQLYAIIEHHGPLSTLEQTLSAFYGHWLPESDYKHAGGPEIEFYDQRFKLNAADSVFETWVPVIKR